MEGIIAQVFKTALDAFRMLPEGTLCEVIGNALYVFSTPEYGHQRIVGLFARQIGNHLDKTKNGFISLYPLDVCFEDLMSAVQPDVMYVSNENMNILHDDGYFYGAPDLIIEVLLSDKKTEQDTKEKSFLRKSWCKGIFYCESCKQECNCLFFTERKLPAIVSN